MLEGLVEALQQQDDAATRLQEAQQVAACQSVQSALYPLHHVVATCIAALQTADERLVSAKHVHGVALWAAC